MIIDGRQFTIAQMRDYIGGLDFKPWRPSGVMIHNTGAPTLAQWMAYPVDRRIQNLKGYYESLGWRSGPHFFVDPNPNGIIVFTPPNQKGTHSPNFNGTHIGIECVGDYSREDDDKGPGQEVKRNMIALVACLCERLGIDPGGLKMHKDDKGTTHDCPGKDLYEDRQQIIQMVREAMGHGGEHPSELVIDGALPDPKQTHAGVTNTPDLNLRENSSAGSRSLGALPKGLKLKVFREAVNGETPWLYVTTPAGVKGWVAKRFVDLSPVKV